MSKTLRELAQAAGGIAWSWWTSNSTLRLTSDRGSKDGDVLSAYRAADGVANVECPEQYRAYIEAASPAAVLNLHAELDRVTAERDALQQRLSAADQRIDELGQSKELLREAYNEASPRLPYRIRQKIEQFFDGLVVSVSQDAETAVEYGPTPGCKQCEEAEACGFTDCPECDAQLHQDVNGTGFQPGREPK